MHAFRNEFTTSKTNRFVSRKGLINDQKRILNFADCMKNFNLTLVFESEQCQGGNLLSERACTISLGICI